MTRPRIVQAGAPLDLRGTAGAPFSLSVAVEVEPDTVVLSGWAVEAQVVPSVTPGDGLVVVSWSAEQTAQMTGAKPWALTVMVDGDGPHPVLAGSVWMAPMTRPGDATTVEHDVSVLVGSTVELDLAVTVGGTSGIVVEVVGGDGVTVDASDPARPVVGVTPGAFVAGDDPRLSDARTPTSHGNEAHTSTFVDAGGAAAAAPVQSVNGKTGAVTLGGASALDVGTGAGTVAAGDDSRIVGAIPASTLTTDGDILTRTSGVPARITRDDLAADAAFSGRYAPVSRRIVGQSVGPIGAAGSYQLFPGQMRLVPIVSEGGPIDRIAVRVQTGGSAGALIRLLLYEDGSNGLPGDLLLDAGTLAAETSGATVQATVAESVARIVWAAVMPEGSPVTQPTIVGVVGSSPLVYQQAATPVSGYYVNDLSSPPDPCPAPGNSTQVGPWVTLRAAATP